MFAARKQITLSPRDAYLEEMFKDAPRPEPVPEWLEAIRERIKYTPDSGRIEKKLFHRVLVVDDMQEGLKNTQRLGMYAAKHSVPAITVESFSLLKKAAGSYTTAIPLRNKLSGVPFLPIKGQLFTVNSSQFFELDKHKLNTVEFIRQDVEFVVPLWLSKKNPETGEFERIGIWTEGPYKAQMYVGNSDYWMELWRTSTKMKLNGDTIPTRISGDGVLSPVRAFKPNYPELPNYYQFTALENEPPDK